MDKFQTNSNMHNLRTRHRCDLQVMSTNLSEPIQESCYSITITTLNHNTELFKPVLHIMYYFTPTTYVNLPQMENLNHLKNILQKKKNYPSANKYLIYLYFVYETSTEKTYMGSCYVLIFVFNQVQYLCYVLHPQIIPVYNL